MMKKSKRIAALTLSLVLMLGVLPLGLSPEAEATSPTDALADIAYYGDREKCALTYDMAQTYIEALEEFEGKDNVEVCLADLADDGYPIMFVLEGQSDDQLMMYIFDRDVFSDDFRTIFLMDPENCYGLEYCEIDGWPALLSHERYSDHLTNTWFTLCTGTLFEASYYVINEPDEYRVDHINVYNPANSDIDEADILRYYKECRHYIPGDLIADFSGDVFNFSLPACKLENAHNALSAYAEAVAPAPYSSALGNIAYHGDRSKCRMTAEMAEAYADVIESLPSTYEDANSEYYSLYTALVDPADDGLPVLFTAYFPFRGLHYHDIRYWGYADGKAYDVQMPTGLYSSLGKIGDKGLIMSADCDGGVFMDTNRYYSVSEAQIKLEHTVKVYTASATGYSDEVPDDADYIIKDYGSGVQVDTSKLSENGWQQADFRWDTYWGTYYGGSWHLVLLDGKNISDSCSTNFDIEEINSYNFNAIAYNLPTEPVTYLFDMTPLGITSDITSYYDVMSAALKAYAFSFTDVPESAWYHQWVREAYQMGLINGKTATTYCPKDNMRYAEAVKLAACMHQRYTDGEVTLENGKNDWRSTYYDYCLENGIIPAAPEGEELGYKELYAKAGSIIDRRTFVWLFSRALPAEAFPEINSIPDDSIPDVPVDDGIWDDGIYLFYRAGILNGSDAKGTFNPGSSIQRSEVAAILVRMMDAHYRVDAPAELGK